MAQRPMTCPLPGCGRDVQATRKTYLNVEVDDDGAPHLVTATFGGEPATTYQLYCEADHNLGEGDNWVELVLEARLNDPSFAHEEAHRAEDLRGGPHVDRRECDGIGCPRAGT